MIPNSQGAQSQKNEQLVSESSQKKRIRELEDDSAEAEKLSKIENYPKAETFMEKYFLIAKKKGST